MLARLLTSLVLATVSTLGSAEPLRVTADPSCPYVCPDPQDPSRLGKKPGIIYEILDAILKPAGYQIEAELLPYSRGLRSVQTGHIDAMLVTLKDDAPKLLFHKTPLAQAKGCFVTRKDNTWSYEGTESLDAISFGGTLGYKYGPLKAYIEQEEPNTVMVSGEETFDRLLHLVEIGRLDATIEDINVIDYQLKQLQLTHKMRLAGCLPPLVPLYVGISQQYPAKEELALLIDQGLKTLKDDGRQDAILKKYGLGSPLPSPTANQ